MSCSSSRLNCHRMLMQIVSQILSCFKISSTRLLAQQCGKCIAYSANCEPKRTNPITLTAYSLLPTQSYPFNVHQIATSGGKFSIFSGNSTYKKYRSAFTKTRHFNLKNPFFLGSGLAPSTHPNSRPPTKSSGSARESQSDLRLCGQTGYTAYMLTKSKMLNKFLCSVGVLS